MYKKTLKYLVILIFGFFIGKSFNFESNKTETIEKIEKENNNQYIYYGRGVSEKQYNF